MGAQSFSSAALPGQAVPGKPSSSQATPWQAEEPGLIRKPRLFYDSVLISPVHKQKNSALRWPSTRYKHSHPTLAEITDLDQDFTPRFTGAAMQATSFALQIPICTRNQT